LSPSFLLRLFPRKRQLCNEASADITAGKLSAKPMPLRGEVFKELDIEQIFFNAGLKLSLAIKNVYDWDLQSEN
jgi:hypothetical protein